MKKVFILLGVLLSSVFGYGENKIQMVTYFPVPYVAYSKVNVNKQMDVGLTNTCAMNLGCNESGSAGLKPLQATTVNLNRGKLDLNTGAAALSTSVTMGSGAGTVEMNFGQDLRVGTLNNGYTVETNQMTVDVLKLFPSRIKNDFPSCASTGASGAPQVSWQQLKLKDKEETYLVCGTAKEEERCQPTHNGQETYTEPCPLGQTGNITYTWDYNLCTYKIQSSCKVQAKIKCLAPAFCGFYSERKTNCMTPVKSCASASFRYGMQTITLNEHLWSQGISTTMPLGCSPGKECAACEVGKKYFVRTPLYSRTCGTAVNCNTEYRYQYVTCVESSLGSCPAVISDPCASLI